MAPRRKKRKITLDIYKHKTKESTFGFSQGTELISALGVFFKVLSGNRSHLFMSWADGKRSLYRRNAAHT